MDSKRITDAGKGIKKEPLKSKKKASQGADEGKKLSLQGGLLSDDYRAVDTVDKLPASSSTSLSSQDDLLVSQSTSLERNQETFERLKRQEDQFRLLAEQSPDLILRFDRAGRILYANSKIEAATGFSPEAVVGKTWAEKGMKPQCVAFWESLVEKTFATRLEQDEEHLCELPSGTKIFQIRTALESVDCGEPNSVIAVARDITQRRRTEQDIMELSQRLLYLVNHSPLAVVEWHPDGKCLSWDGEAESLFGWTQAEVRESSIASHQLIHPTCRFEFEETFERLKNGTQSSAYHLCRTINKKGEVLHCEWFLSALRYDCGRTRSVLALVNDVTEREKADQEIKEMKEALESTVERRTALLKQANEELKSEIVNRRQLEFDLIQVSEREHRRIGHDLHDGICQELAGVRFALESISRKLGNLDPIQKDLQSLSDGIHRAIHHTRILSRGLAPMDLERGDLVAALAEFVENSSALYKIECDLELRGEPLILSVESATHLFRIAQEALQNAVKHGQASKVNVLLDFSASPAQMVVRDNGSRDCPQPDRPKNGMGLKIMQHRAALLSGTVNIEVLESGGTEVRTTFPKQTIPHAS